MSKTPSRVEIYTPFSDSPIDFENLAPSLYFKPWKRIGTYATTKSHWHFTNSQGNANGRELPKSNSIIIKTNSTDDPSII